ncbi:PaaI family thioesterase [Methanobrevibacter sp.]|uniref:PaaI family thioesterase n=1 Tax=Methanobrevibacter sp. TaxID=66852 RepID=UPI003863BE9D
MSINNIGVKMVNFNTIESAREFFYKDKFAVNTGITLDELSEDEAICSLSLTDEHRNAYGGVMGGVIFTLADFAFAVLSNQIHQLTVAQQVDIHYLSAPKGDKLIAKATCRKSGRTSSIINVDISDDTGRDVAQFIGTGFKL